MTQTTDRPIFGIALMLVFCMIVPLSDALAKLLGQEVSLLTLVTLRFVFPVLLLLPLIWHRKSVLVLNRATYAWLALRMVLHVLGMGLMFSALWYLPLADAVAIAFVAPFIQLYMGHLFLGEHVGPHRIGAAAVGFIGTLFVIQPNFIAVGAAALLPLGVALAFSGFALVTRRIAKQVDPMATQVLGGGMGAALLLPLWLAFDPTSLGALASNHLGPLVLFGVIGTFSALVMTWALRFAPSATLAPMQYIEIPFATLMGWWFFRDLPNGLAALGIAITVAAGLYVIGREHRQARLLARNQDQLQAHQEP